MAAEFRLDDEKAHETEFPVVGGDGASPDQFAIQLRGYKGIGIRSPEEFRIVQTRILAFSGSLLDQPIDLDPGHILDSQRIVHLGSPGFADEYQG